MKHLYVVRHAQSEHHVRDYTGGWTDLPLTALGAQQAERLAGRLAALVTARPVTLFSSDLQRAEATARSIAKRLGLSIRLDAGLRELDNGQAAGLTTAAARTLARERTEPLLDWQHYPGAETWRQMTDRVAACMERLASESAASAIVVGHAGSGSAILKWWLRLPESCRHSIHFELEPASLTQLCENDRRERVVVRVNDTAHLRA